MIEEWLVVPVNTAMMDVVFQLAKQRCPFIPPWKPSHQLRIMQ